MGRSAETRGKRDKIYPCFLSVLDKKRSKVTVFMKSAVLYSWLLMASLSGTRRNGEPPMKLLEALALPVLEHARVVAGVAGVEREVLWVHIVDLPDPLPWVR